MNEGNFFENIESGDFCRKLDEWIAGYHRSVQQLEFENEA